MQNISLSANHVNISMATELTNKLWKGFSRLCEISFIFYIYSWEFKCGNLIMETCPVDDAKHQLHAAKFVPPCFAGGRFLRPDNNQVCTCRVTSRIQTNPEKFTCMDWSWPFKAGHGHLLSSVFFSFRRNDDRAEQQKNLFYFRWRRRAK